jgi:choloylglycine hydrolase
MKNIGFGVRHCTVTIVAILVYSIIFVKIGQACTEIRLIAKDGTVVYARTLEFGIDLDSKVLVVPRGYARTGATPQGDNGFAWKSKYASLGANGVGLPYLFDGRWLMCRRERLKDSRRPTGP